MAHRRLLLWTSQRVALVGVLLEVQVVILFRRERKGPGPRGYRARGAGATRPTPDAVDDAWYQSKARLRRPAAVDARRPARAQRIQKLGSPLGCSPWAAPRRECIFRRRISSWAASAATMADYGRWTTSSSAIGAYWRKKERQQKLETQRRRQRAREVLAHQANKECALAASFYSLRVVRVGIARHVHVASMAPRATPSTRCPTQISTRTCSSAPWA